jgi:hypothetical protein
MSEWITDRLPTEEDAQDGRVLIMYHGEMITDSWHSILKRQPWMRLPAPYVKPKRWTVEWCGSTWILRDNRQKCSYNMSGLAELGRNGGDAAQRIADVFNEILP